MTITKAISLLKYVKKIQKMLLVYVFYFSKVQLLQKHRHIKFVWASGFQPVCRGTLVCRERSPDVSRKILEKTI